MAEEIFANANYAIKYLAPFIFTIVSFCRLYLLITSCRLRERCIEFQAKLRKELTSNSKEAKNRTLVSVDAKFLGAKAKNNSQVLRRTHIGLKTSACTIDEGISKIQEQFSQFDFS